MCDATADQDPTAGPEPQAAHESTPVKPGDLDPGPIGSRMARVGAGLSPSARADWAAQADRHNPRAAFLTCVDARVVPALLTGTAPGELYVIRNVGNLIPHGPAAESSVAGALQFAVESLEVPELVICGHSACGGMAAVLAGIEQQPTHLRAWLRAAEPTAQRWRSGSDGAFAGMSDLDRLVRVNVVQQLDHARALPFVRDAEEQGRLRLTAVVFDIASTSATVYDESTGDFRPFPDSH